MCAYFDAVAGRWVREIDLRNAPRSGIEAKTANPRPLTWPGSRNEHWVHLTAELVSA
jgi:hypothetical protein